MTLGPTAQGLSQRDDAGGRRSYLSSMTLSSALAVYALFWTMTLFVVLPFGIRTAEEAGAQCMPGHAESAPHEFRLGRVALRTTIASAVLFALFYANYVNGWVGTDILDWMLPRA